MSPLLTQFIQETREMLEQAAAGLLELERACGDADLLNTVFRSVHTIKGAAGLFEFDPLIQVLHAAEDLLDKARDGSVTLDQDLTDLLLETLDTVSRWVDAIEARETLPEDAPAEAGRWVARLRAPLGTVAAGADPRPEPNEVRAEAPPGWLARLPEELRLSLYRACREGDLTALSYTPGADCFFSGEDPLYLLRQTPELRGLLMDTAEPWPDPDSLDPYHCVMRFHALSGARRDSLEELFRYVADQVILQSLPAHWLAVPVGAHVDDPAYEEFVQDALGQLERGQFEALAWGVDALMELVPRDSWQGSALRWLATLLDAPRPDPQALRVLIQALPQAHLPGWSREEPESDTADEPRESLSEARPDPGRPDPREYAAFQHLLQEQLRILELPTEPAHWQGRLYAVTRSTRNALRYIGRATDDDLDEALAQAEERRSADPLRRVLRDVLEQTPGPGEPVAAAGGETPEGRTPEGRTPEGRTPEGRTPDGRTPDGRTPQAPAMDEARADRGPAVSRMLKIDQAKIDRLMELVGELVVAKNGLPFLARRAAGQYGVRELSREIKDQYAVIDRIAQEMQGAVMQVRMLPVANIFQRFPRLVRDTARKLGKQVDLALEGEDTEADKNIIEALSEPMIHLLRNSLDHGLETPGERQAAGKPPTGTLRIRAGYENDTVAIEISDDGRGIDPESVKLKAYQKGLLDEARLADISDEDAVQLIFAPGLSTAGSVSDLSGRGVGMDAVRSAIERVGGAVMLGSKPGEGTVVRLNLPLSMAVTQVLAVQAAGQVWGVPMNAVAETVRIPWSQVSRVKRKEVFVLRRRVVPLIRLRSLLGLEDCRDDSPELAVLVVRVRGAEVGLVVDHFREVMETILRPLDGVLSALKIYSGTALLGDGSVLLVLNPQELIHAH